MRGTSGKVSSVAISADGKRVVSGSDDGTVAIWDAETGAEVRGAGGVEGLCCQHTMFSNVHCANLPTFGFHCRYFFWWRDASWVRVVGSLGFRV